MKTALFIMGVGLGMLISVTLINSFPVSTNAHKVGQVDCINGKIYYELVTQQDGSTKWEFKK